MSLTSTEQFLITLKNAGQLSSRNVFFVLSFSPFHSFWLFSFSLSYTLTLEHNHMHICNICVPLCGSWHKCLNKPRKQSRARKAPTFFLLSIQSSMLPLKVFYQSQGRTPQNQEIAAMEHSSIFHLFLQISFFSEEKSQEAMQQACEGNHKSTSASLHKSQQQCGQQSKQNWQIFFAFLLSHIGAKPKIFPYWDRILDVSSVRNNTLKTQHYLFILRLFIPN